MNKKLNYELIRKCICYKLISTVAVLQSKLYTAFFAGALFSYMDAPNNIINFTIMIATGCIIVQAIIAIVKNIVRNAPTIANDRLIQSLYTTIVSIGQLALFVKGAHYNITEQTTIHLLIIAIISLIIEIAIPKLQNNSFIKYVDTHVFNSNYFEIDTDEYPSLAHDIKNPNVLTPNNPFSNIETYGINRKYQNTVRLKTITFTQTKSLSKNETEYALALDIFPNETECSIAFDICPFGFDYDFWRIQIHKTKLIPSLDIESKNN